MHTTRHLSSRLGALLVFLFALGVTSIGLLPPAAPSVASASPSCPDGTGYGGQIATLAASAPSQGGHGCVVIIHSNGTEVFTYTGAVQQWTVPTGVTTVELHLVGAGGGGALQGQGGSSGGTGGGGGYATGTLDVTPGTNYDVVVGQGGRHHCRAENVQDLTLDQRRNFSFGGGAAGYGEIGFDCSWASGGGRSALRTAGGSTDIVTAGGGGGGGYTGNGGSGGGQNGQSGAGACCGASNAGGGTQNTGGLGGVGSENGYDGIQYAGGPAGVDSAAASEAGGGGGGYFGGGGAGNNGGGGGGSSFVGGVQNGSTNAGNWRIPGAVPPTGSAPPSISGNACIGSSLIATTGAWSGATSTSLQWQTSSDGSSWSDVAGATSSSFTVTTSGFVRVTELGRNLFGSSVTNSAATTAISDTSLSGLDVSHGTLVPAFSSAVFSYSLEVPNSQTSITLTPTISANPGTVTVSGTAVPSGSATAPIPLQVGSNLIEIVTGNASCSMTTALTVTRLAATPVSTPLPPFVPSPPTTTIPSSTTVVGPGSPNQPSPSISAPDSARRGTEVTIVASGFIPGESVQIRVDETGDFHTLIADENGEVRLTITLTHSNGDGVRIRAIAGERTATMSIRVYDEVGTLPVSGSRNFLFLVIGATSFLAGATLLIVRRDHARSAW